MWKTMKLSDIGAVARSLIHYNTCKADECRTRRTSEGLSSAVSGPIVCQQKLKIGRLPSAKMLRLGCPEFHRLGCPEFHGWGAQNFTVGVLRISRAPRITKEISLVIRLASDITCLYTPKPFYPSGLKRELKMPTCITREGPAWRQTPKGTFRITCTMRGNVADFSKWGEGGTTYIPH